MSVSFLNTHGLPVAALKKLLAVLLLLSARLEKRQGELASCVPGFRSFYVVGSDGPILKYELGPIAGLHAELTVAVPLWPSKSVIVLV